MSIGDWALANPGGLWWALAAVPIVLLHVLRPRRIQARVAALLLWRKVARPVSAARPWQRLIPSWLLLAQILVALGLAVLMADPVRLTDNPVADHTVFVIDASGSMQAADGSPSRLDDAKKRALELWDQIPEGGTASIVSAGLDARAVLTHSADRADFVESLASIRATPGASDAAGAFALAAGLDTGIGTTSTVFVSDGGVSAADLRAAPTGTRYERVGSSAANRAISGISAEHDGSQMVVHLAVTHHGGPSASQTLRVDVDGITAATREVEMSAGDVVNLSLPVRSGELIEAFLEGSDALALDDRAVATASRPQSVKVLWAGGPNVFLQSALGAIEGVEIVRAGDLSEPLAPDIDVVVADRVAVPDELDAPLLAVAVPGGAGSVEVVGAVDQPVLTLVRAAEPLLADLDFSDVFLAEAQRLEVAAVDEVLLAAESAPLLVVAEDGDLVYFAAPLDRTTLPLQIAFPLLMDRVIRDLAGASLPPARIEAGEPLPIDPRLEATVTSPAGTTASIAPGAGYMRADRIGFWRIEQDGRPPVTVGVTAVPAESSIAPLPDLPFAEAFEGAPGSETERGEQRRLWPVVAALLVLIAVEWLLARRRRGVGRRQWRVAGGLRVLVCAALAALLLAPTLSLADDRVGVVFVVDASDSMGGDGRFEAVEYVRQALAERPGHSHAGVVAFGADARLENLVRADPVFAGVTVEIDRSATDIAAALRLGAAALPPDVRGRLVVISDGRATLGDASREAQRLADEVVPADAVVIRPPAGLDVSVTGVEAPASVADGAIVEIVATVESPTAAEAEVSLWRSERRLQTRQVSLLPGANRVVFADEASGDALLRYRVEVDAAGDRVGENDLGFAAVSVVGAERVLLAEASGISGDHIAVSLQSAGIEVDRISPERLPALDELSRYSSIVLADVDRRDLSERQIADLAAVVSDLGRGLVVVGGTHSYALGGYRESELESLLPVISEITDPLRRQTVAEVLAIDTSGSMDACHCDEDGRNGLGGGNRLGGGVSKTAIARNAAARVISALAATDEVGVLSIDADDEWLLDLQSSPPQALVDEALEAIVPEGPTFVDTGLLTAAEALRSSNASLKHIIFFSDGFTEPFHLDQAADQAAELAAEGITVSVVATGEGAAPDLAPIAEAGGGRFYPGRNLDEVPDLIVAEAILASRDFVNEGEFAPTITSNAQVVSWLTEAPLLNGYVATTAKPSARVHLRIGPEADPLLASWQAGLGRVTAWTSDGGDRWAAPWAAWERGADFWSRLVRDTFPAAADGGAVSTRVEGRLLEIRVESADDWPADSSAVARVATPDGSSVEVPLQRLDGSTFAGSAPAPEAGTYAVGATVRADGEPVWGGTGLAARSYPAEYEARPVDERLLASLAASTGGRLDVAPDQVFDAVGTEAGTRRLDLVPWLLLFAVIGWLLAVAVSRLAWRRGLLAVGAAQAAGTVAELRRRLPKFAEPEPTADAAPDGSARPGYRGSGGTDTQGSSSDGSNLDGSGAGGQTAPAPPAPGKAAGSAEPEGSWERAPGRSGPPDPSEASGPSSLERLLDRKRRRQ